MPSSTGDQGRSRLLLGTISLVLLMLAVAIAAGSLAPAADARALKKCDWDGGRQLKVQNISCKDAANKVAGRVIASFFTGQGVAWGKGCNKIHKPGNVCRYAVAGFQCYGTSRTRYVWASDCTKWNQRERKNLRVDFVIDRRDYG